MGQNNSAVMQVQYSLPELSPQCLSPRGCTGKRRERCAHPSTAPQPPGGHHPWETLWGLALGGVKGLQQCCSFLLQIPPQHFPNTGNKACSEGSERCGCLGLCEADTQIRHTAQAGAVGSGSAPMAAPPVVV